MSQRFACAVCRRIITDVTATVEHDRVNIHFRCHGEQHTFPVPLEMRGVLFHDKSSVLDLPSRNPDEYLRLASEEEGQGTDRRLAGGSGQSWWTENARVAALGE